MRKKSKLIDGFTLVELLVSITILSAAITGPLLIASKGIQNSITAKNRLIATQLAQEAIEFLRFRRDTQFLLTIRSERGGSKTEFQWNDWAASCRGANGCVVDVQQDKIRNCGTCGPMYTKILTRTENPATGNRDVLYYYQPNMQFPAISGGTPSPFTRIVKISELYDAPQDTGENINVVVSWNERGKDYSVILSENLYKWKEPVP